MFEASLALIEDCGLAFLHVFPYSARAGTPAARMPQLPMALRKVRAARLRARGNAVLRLLPRPVCRAAASACWSNVPAVAMARASPEIELDGGAPGEILPVEILGRRAGRPDRSIGRMSEKTGWLGRLAAGLKRTSSRLGEGITGIFTKRRLDKRRWANSRTC